jgi:hypothetical protein
MLERLETKRTKRRETSSVSSVLRVFYFNCFMVSPSNMNDSSEAALDTLAEIVCNHFVARRAMLLRMAERQHETEELTAPALQRLTETGFDFLAITAAEFQFRAVV